MELNESRTENVVLSPTVPLTALSLRENCRFGHLQMLSAIALFVHEMSFQKVDVLKPWTKAVDGGETDTESYKTKIMD